MDRGTTRELIIEFFKTYRDLNYSMLVDGTYIRSSDSRPVLHSLPIPTGMPINLMYEHFNRLSQMSRTKKEEVQFGPFHWEGQNLNDIDFSQLLSPEDVASVAKVVQCHCIYIDEPFAELKNNTRLSDKDIRGRSLIWTIISEVMVLFPSLFY